MSLAETWDLLKFATFSKAQLCEGFALWKILEAFSWARGFASFMTFDLKHQDES